MKAVKVQAAVRGMLAKKYTKQATRTTAGGEAAIAAVDGKSTRPTPYLASNAVLPFDTTGGGGGSERVMERARTLPPRQEATAQQKWMRATRKRTKHIFDAAAVWSASYLDFLACILFTLAFVVVHIFTLWASLQPSAPNAALGLPDFCVPCE